MVVAGLEGLQNLLFQRIDRFSRLWRDSRFHLQNSENEANLLALLHWLSVTLLIVAKHQAYLCVCKPKTSFLLGSI